VTGGAPERGSGARRDRLGRIAASLPGPLQTLARLAFVATRVTRGPRSFVNYVRLARIRRHEGSDGRVVRIRLRELDGRPMAIRPSTSDVDTIWGTFAGRYHRPPAEALDRDLRLIWDLGANIGLTMADLAVRHPRAQVVGLEMDPENAALARENTAPWSDRCEVIEAAAWPSDGQLGYVQLVGATSGHHVTAVSPEDDPGLATADAISPYSLLALCGPDAVVDYAKVDIEGAESALLRDNAGWAHRVRTMTVEVHAPYTVADCEHDLGELGFDTRVDPRHWACVIGVRPATDAPT